MNTTVRLALLAGFCWIWNAAAAPDLASERSGTALVERLYKDYAWQAIVATPSHSRTAFGEALQWQGRVVLERYFAPGLAELIVRDARCKIKTHRLCRLEFDPLFASPDPGAADLRIRAAAPGHVEVEFRYPSSGELVRLDYVLGAVRGQPRIVDVRYASLGDVTLKQILSRRDE